MFAKMFGSVRFIYNKMFGNKIDYYKEYKKMLKNIPAQYKEEFEWLKEVYLNIGENTLTSTGDGMNRQKS